MFTNLWFSGFLLCSLLASSIALDLALITPRELLRDGDTVVSADQLFQFGFFSLGVNSSGAGHRFLGVWYKQLSSKAFVWVANRDNPLKDRSGVLNLSSQGNLHLLDGKNKVFWSSEVSRPAKNPVLKLLSSGNLVLSDDAKETVLWQSFDYPVDTLLAGMKLGKNFLTKKQWSLTSWRTPEDPSTGEFSLVIDTRGLPQLIMKKNNVNYYRLGPWNGITFTGTPELREANNIFKYMFVLSAQQVTYSWEPQRPLFSRLFLNDSGFVQRLIRTAQDGWILGYSAPADRCDYYSVCGAYATCSISKNEANCFCLQGFVPKSSQKWIMSKWADGCVREIKIECANDEKFDRYSGMKLPDTSASWYDAGMDLDECKDRCSSNCSCRAYANIDIRDGGKGCLLWFDDLVDMRVYSDGGQDVYIRMANAKKADNFVGSSGRRRKYVGVVIGLAVVTGVILIGLMVCCRWWKMKRDRENFWREEDGEDDMDLPIFDMKTVARATDEFSYTNFLGQGGFGPVYKGKLEGGREIAVKRLSANSGQGIQEFKNEVKLIAKLQHRNLVRLLGCCVQGDEQMLIYEYMPNKSLDHFIFDASRSKALDWPSRMNIIRGIARGLLYLHQDSRLRIIHRDLKTGNVLLDNEMKPKISDFGLAKSFGGDQIEANTNKVVGTYGYMSPEYAVDGNFSVKSDVFSFGVIVLETVSGKKNRGFRHSGHDLNLLGHAWRLWLEDRALELADEVLLGESCIVSEVLRCAHVGLLCVQQKPEDRPNMASVVLMLMTDASLPQPKQPGFFTGRNILEVSSSISAPSLNEISVTLSFDGR